MTKKHLISAALAALFVTHFSINANETLLQSLGKTGKDNFYLTASTQTTTPSFPALYVYSVDKQEFLSKKSAIAYLGTLDSRVLWTEATVNWAKETAQLSTTNVGLSESVPVIKLDREYVIYYDNLPAAMLAGFKEMEPNLVKKDQILKSVLSSQVNSRAYTTY